MIESLEDFGNRWHDRALGAETEIERLRAELAQAIEHRNYWHREAMSATTRIAELEPCRESRQQGVESTQALIDAGLPHK